MLEIIIPEMELFDDANSEIIHIKQTTLQLEHSLLSIKKWESKWHKPFLGGDEKTIEEVLDYISCMSLNRQVDKNIYKYLPEDSVKRIVEYIQNPMTATTFTKVPGQTVGRSNGTFVTAEIIYYWMIALQIPVEFEKWHLNQLLTLIDVVNIKSSPKKKMSRKDAAAQRRALNAQRRAKYNTKG